MRRDCSHYFKLQNCQQLKAETCNHNDQIATFAQTNLNGNF